MNLMDHFETLLEYEIQANAETLKFLRAAKGDTHDAALIFAHVQAVRDLWLRRLRREDTTGFNPFPAWTLDQSEAAMRKMDIEWSAQIETASADRLEDTLLYEDTKGGFWSTRAYDAIVQALNHSTHHRGQIAVLLRKAGDIPMQVDYIGYHRQKEEG